MPPKPCPDNQNFTMLYEQLLNINSFCSTSATDMEGVQSSSAMGSSQAGSANKPEAVRKSPSMDIALAEFNAELERTLLSFLV